MATTTALRCSRLTDDLSGVAIEDVDARAPGPGEVAVSMRAAALNFPDLLMTRGGYQHRPELPFTVGMEGAGVVESVGAGVTGWAPGDAVCVSDKTGTIARRAVVAADALSAAPRGWSWGEAAGWQVGALTAYVALAVRGGLRAGETLLVHGATGGMGAAAVQLGAALGATVIATGSRNDWLERLRPMGASTLLSSREDFAPAVKAATGGRGADVIYDPVGGDVFDESVRCIAFDGRLLIIGFTSGRIPSVSVNMPLIKGFSVMGVRAGEYGRQFPERGRENQKAIWKLAADGVVRPRVYKEFTLAQWREAFDTLADRQVVGKTIIRPDL